MKVQIDTCECIIIDGQATKHRVTQRPARTVVFSTDNMGNNYAEYKMPRQRYTLSTPAGIEQFSKDLQTIIK
jgi:hypothetical protein